MPVGAAVSAAGAVAGAGIGALGAKSAAKTQANAANNAADLQLKMFNTTREDLAPYRDYGASAIPALNKLLGLGGGGDTRDFGGYVRNNADVLANYNNLLGSDEGRAQLASQNVKSIEDYGRLHYNAYGQNEGRALGQLTGSANPIQAQLESLPGYQFARDQGILSATRALGSKGQTGAQVKGIARFVTGLADQTYGEQVNRLSTAATLGQNAAAQTGNLGVQTGSNVGNALVGAGTASAAGTVGAANAFAGGIGNFTNAYLTNKLLNGGGLYGSAASDAMTSNFGGLFGAGY